MVLMEFCFFGFDQIRPSAISPTTQTKLGRSNANRNKLKRAIHTAHTKAQNPQADCFSFSNSRAEDNGKDQCERLMPGDPFSESAAGEDAGSQWP